MKNHTLAKVGLLTALSLTTLYVGCCINVNDNYKAKAYRTEELDASVADMTSVDVTTKVGTLTFEAADVTEAHIVADITVKAKTQEEAEAQVREVRIVAEPSGERLALKAVKPKGFGCNKLLVDFTVTIPARLALECRTNVGDIKTTGLAGPVTARTDVGSILCNDLLHGATLRTNVGNIVATYASEAPAALQVSAVTNVGDIELAGPDSISAALSASVNVGSIDAQRPLMVQGPIKKSIKATLGKAEGRVKLSTNVGSIRIR